VAKDAKSGEKVTGYDFEIGRHLTTIPANHYKEEHENEKK